HKYIARDSEGRHILQIFAANFEDLLQTIESNSAWREIKSEFLTFEVVDVDFSVFNGIIVVIDNKNGNDAIIVGSGSFSVWYPIQKRIQEAKKLIHWMDLSQDGVKFLTKKGEESNEN
ncbi:MAG: hypothetical protein ACUVQP_00005, partial [Bacteroidales bacterium]